MIGTRIRQACEAVEKLGTSDYRPIAAVMDIDITNAHKYCDRAVNHGLMTVNRKIRPVQYTVVPGWREQLGAINAS